MNAEAFCSILKSHPNSWSVSWPKQSPDMRLGLRAVHARMSAGPISLLLNPGVNALGIVD